MIALSFLALPCAAGADTGLLRAYGRLGICALAPSGEDLGYVDLNGDSALDGGNSTEDLIEYGGGIQVLMPFPGSHEATLSMGMDMSLVGMYGIHVDNSYSSVTVTYDEGYAFLNASAVAEIAINDSFFAQCGVGVYLKAWDYRYFFDSDYASLDEDTYETGVDPCLGLLGAVGWRTSIGDRISLFVMARADLVFTWGATLPIGLIAGADFGI